MTPFRHLLATAAAAAALLGTASAASGCTAAYALADTAIVTVYPNRSTSMVTTLPTTSNNGMALHPITGEIYYVDRTDQSAPKLRRFNPGTRADTLIGTLNEPTNINTRYNANIGATFDHSTGTPRLYLLYGTYQITEVDLNTAATVRTIDINLPPADNTGRNVTKRTSLGNVYTSGDFVFTPDGTAYAALDATRGLTSLVYQMNLGKLSNVTGTSITASNLSALERTNGNHIGAGNVNGTAYDPLTGNILISYVDSSTTSASGNSMLSTITATNTRVNAGMSTDSYTDLSDCTTLPDPPAITKSFNRSKALTGTVSTLTITLGNSNPSPYYTQNAITDTLPGTLVVAPNPGASTTCRLSNNTVPSFVPAAGAQTVTLPANLTVPSGGCTFTVNVTSSAPGVLTNTIAASGVVTTSGTPESDAVATVQYQYPLVNSNGSTATTITKTQALCSAPGTCAAPGTAPVKATPGSRVEYCLSAQHPGTNYADATQSTLGDLISPHLTIDPNAYGAGRGVRITRAGVTTTSGIGTSNTPGGAWREGAGNPYNLRIDIAPFAGGTKVTACFQATIQ